MSERIARRVFGIGLVLAVIAVLGLVGWRLATFPDVEKKRNKPAASPVQVAPIIVSAIAERRQFSGALRPAAELVVAAKIAGRLESVLVQRGDVVQRGAIIARLDDDEYAQAVTEAEAAIVVAQARLREARSTVGAAERAFARFDTLAEQGLATQSLRDQTEAEMLSRQAAVAVAEAEIQQAEAELAGARIRLGYCTITARWSEDDPERVVGERLVDSGTTISAHQPLVRVLALDPLIAEIHVTESMYGRLHITQKAILRTDAWPEHTFSAKVLRIAPRFADATRQAIVELEVDNEEGLLKPGMFVRATIELAHDDMATVVPATALTRRNGKDVVFVVNDDGNSVREVAVRLGIRDNERVQISGLGLQGQVVTLGQQLVEDGSEIIVPGAVAP